MDFDRRRFLSSSAVSVGAFGLMNSPFGSEWVKDHLTHLGQAAPYRGKLAILQGVTTPSSAQFSVLTEASRHYGYTVVDPLGNIQAVEITRRETRGHSAWGIEKLRVRNLKVGQDYRLQVISPDSGQVFDERIFSALDTEARQGSFVIASCMKDSQSNLREVMWDAVSECRPDLVFLIGDTCYADNGLSSQDEAGYWRRYAETRSLLSHFRQKRLIPTLATWDDHDFGGNNYDSSFGLKETLRDLFDVFWGHETVEGLSQGPGVSQVWTVFGQRFFLTDCRFFRSPKSHGGRPVHWGQSQEEFLLSHLSASKKPAWILNGSQIFGGYLKKDAFEYGQEQNLKDLCREFSKLEAPVAFASGDVHFSELMNIEPEIFGYPTFEITSSSIHSTTFPGQHLKAKNKRRIRATSANNFVRVQAQNSLEGWSVHAQCLGKSLKSYFQHSFLVQR